MRKCFLIFLAVLMLTTGAFAECGCSCISSERSELPGLTEKQQSVFEAIRWSDSHPKSAQVLSAMEYYCKVENEQLRLLLIQATQNESITKMYGTSSQILIADVDEGTVYSYQNLSMPESDDVHSRQEALSRIYGEFDSWLAGYNEWIWADSELVYPFGEEDLLRINEALTANFVK